MDAADLFEEPAVRDHLNDVNRSSEESNLRTCKIIIDICMILSSALDECFLYRYWRLQGRTSSGNTAKVQLSLSIAELGVDWSV